MVSRSRVRPKPLPTPRATDPDLGLTYQLLATESFDDMCGRLGIDWSEQESPAEMFARLTGHRPELWPDYMAWADWQERQIEAPEPTLAIETSAVSALREPTDVYAALAALRPSDEIVEGEVVE